jgi:hypothetical protein
MIHKAIVRQQPKKRTFFLFIVFQAPFRLIYTFNLIALQVKFSNSFKVFLYNEINELDDCW